MTGKEVVRRAIEFKNPARLPVRFGYFGMDDTFYLKWNQIIGVDENSRQSYDEWGCLWERSEQDNMGQVKGHPLLDWDDLKNYKFPDPNHPSLYSGMEEQYRENAEGKYVFFEIFMLLFERLHSLRGFNNVLMDLYLEPEKIAYLADRIVEYNLEIIRNIDQRFHGRIDGFYCTDDWGTELNTFISLDMWNDFFKPRYKKIFDACKKAGWHVWLHSCGKVNNFIDGFIDVGVDVLNLQQPRVLGIEEIGKKYAGKVCFATLCDIQHTLPFKSNEEITEEARLLLDCWATDSGGFILMDDGNGEALGIPDSKRKAMLDAFLKYDPFRKRQGGSYE
ncbi:MAG: hypothetical protein GX187_08015 [Clostridiaceae bacterium]|nr:hypothetical protein [Clostridiaceae bacterium]